MQLFIDKISSKEEEKNVDTKWNKKFTLKKKGGKPINKEDNILSKDELNVLLA